MSAKCLRCGAGSEWLAGDLRPGMLIESEKPPEVEELRSLLQRASEALMDPLGADDLRTLLTDIDAELHPENALGRMRYEDLGPPDSKS